MPQSQIQIIDADGLKRTIKRLSYQIIEKNRGVEGLVFIGMRTRGVPLAERIRGEIFEIEGKKLPVGILDVTMYRDDVFKKNKRPRIQPTAIDFTLDGKTVILVDDVLYTGRSVRAALDAVVDFGRPEAIQLAVLVDRGNRELPIQADYVGKDITTNSGQRIKVRLQEVDKEEDSVWLVTKPEGE